MCQINPFERAANQSLLRETRLMLKLYYMKCSLDRVVQKLTFKQQDLVRFPPSLNRLFDEIGLIQEAIDYFRSLFDQVTEHDPTLQIPILQL